MACGGETKEGRERLTWMKKGIDTYLISEGARRSNVASVFFFLFAERNVVLGKKGHRHF